jgi:hypothetical protein
MVIIGDRNVETGGAVCIELVMLVEGNEGKLL